MKYSATFGSFVRGGDYPLEADYIFNSVEELLQWSKENQGILHDGLLKIVKTEDKLSLYWCFNKEFHPLIDLDTLENVNWMLEDFKHHGDIRTVLKEIEELYKMKFKALLQELDETQAGVGLNGDGSFDTLTMKNTVYLEGSRSIVECLKALDAAITDSITEGIIKDTRYDAETETIYLIFSTKAGDKEVPINIRGIIEEWEPFNPIDKAVVLHRDVSITGKDKLSADVKIATRKDNILEKSNGELLVRGTTDNITHEGRDLDKVLNDLKGIKHVFDYYSEALSSNLEIGDYFLVLNDEVEEIIGTENTSNRIYNLVSNVSNIKDGGKYIFAYNNYVMSQADEKDQYRTYEEISNNGNSMLVPLDNDTVLEIIFENGDLGFRLKVGYDLYLTVNEASDSLNYLKTSTLENASEFMFSMNPDTTFLITSTNTNGVLKRLQFNATKGNERFTFYRTGSQKDFNLYLKESIEREFINHPKGLYIITNYGVERIPFYGSIEELHNLLNKEIQTRTFEDNKLQSLIDSMKAMINKMKGWYEAD